MMIQSTTIVAGFHMRMFGRFSLNENPLEVRDGRRLVNLTSKQLEVLALLVHAQGKVVSRDEFLTRIWKESFVEEANITQTIFLLRKILGRLPNGAPLIETVPRQGYRLASRSLQQAEQTKPGNEQIGMREEDQLQMLVQSVDDYAIYMLDCAGRVVTWNPGAERSKGYSSEEIIGQHFSFFFVPEDIESRVPDRELSAAASKGKYAGEGWRIRKNGDRFWASFVITAIRNQSGKLIGFGKVVRDLSDRKRRDDALLRLEALVRRERDRLRAAAESSMDAIYICEAVRDHSGDIVDFIFTYLNKNVEKMVALPHEVMLSGKMCELLPGTRDNGTFDAYKRVVETGIPYVAEISLNEKLVTCTWLRVQAVRLHDGVVITASDISDRKMAEEKLRRYELQFKLTGSM